MRQQTGGTQKAAHAEVTMLLDETVRVALQAIRANKLRSLLTALGIIIGVGAVITMIALGTGAQKAVEARIQALGPTLLTLFAGQSFRGGIAIDNRVSLTMDDDTALAQGARYLSAVVPELAGNLQVQRGSQNVNVNIVGTIPEYVAGARLHADGRPDVHHRRGRGAAAVRRARRVGARHVQRQPARR